MKIYFCTFLLVLIGTCGAAFAEGNEEAPQEMSSETPTEQAPEVPSPSPKKAVIFGHNVTPTTQVLAANDFTVGNYVLGWGATSEWTVAVSPWIWFQYNTPNFHMKWGKKYSDYINYGLFFSYFHSDRHSNPMSSQNLYQWQSASLHGLYSVKTASNKTFYFNLHYAYFWNEDMPYSIRMDPGTEISGQIDLTSLTQIPLSWKNTSVLLEFGGLGINYLYPYVQVGASIAYQGQHWLLQFGYSYTTKFADIGSGKPYDTTRWQEPRWQENKSDDMFSNYRYYEASTHPEIHIQYFF